MKKLLVAVLIFGALPIWLIYIMWWLPLILIGYVVVPIALLCKAKTIRKSRFFPQTITAFSWKWLDYIYGNDEDGILNGRQYLDVGPDWLQIIYWTCVRNPTNNLRFVPIVSVLIKPSKLRYVGSYEGPDPRYDTPVPQWFFASQDLYSNFWLQFNLFGKLYRFWIGWQIYPTDTTSVNTGRQFGAPFVLDFKVIS